MRECNCILASWIFLATISYVWLRTSVTSCNNEFVKKEPSNEQKHGTPQSPFQKVKLDVSNFYIGKGNHKISKNRESRDYILRGRKGIVAWPVQNEQDVGLEVVHRRTFERNLDHPIGSAKRIAQRNGHEYIGNDPLLDMIHGKEFTIRAMPRHFISDWDYERKPGSFRMEFGRMDYPVSREDESLNIPAIIGISVTGLATVVFACFYVLYYISAYVLFLCCMCKPGGCFGDVCGGKDVGFGNIDVDPMSDFGSVGPSIHVPAGASRDSRREKRSKAAAMESYGSSSCDFRRSRRIEI